MTYEIYVRNLNTGVTAIRERNIAGTSWSPSTSLPDDPYRWWVIGVGVNGFKTNWSAPIDF